MKTTLAAVAIACALPLAALAQDMPIPRMMKNMAKGSWRMEILEHSEMKKDRKPPVMTVCSDNLMKDMQAARDKAEKRKPSECKHRLLKDGADEAVWEITCPKRTVTTHMKRESAQSMLMDIQTKGDHPSTMRMRYTNLGPCKAGQQTMSYDKNSPECRKIQEATAKMDPAKQCSGSGDQRAQCEKMMREQLARMKGMCG